MLFKKSDTLVWLWGIRGMQTHKERHLYPLVWADVGQVQVQRKCFSENAKKKVQAGLWGSTYQLLTTGDEKTVLVKTKLKKRATWSCTHILKQIWRQIHEIKQAKKCQSNCENPEKWSCTYRQLHQKSRSKMHQQNTETKKVQPEVALTQYCIKMWQKKCVRIV